jgi:hypothetical protein
LGAHPVALKKTKAFLSPAALEAAENEELKALSNPSQK